MEVQLGTYAAFTMLYIKWMCCLVIASISILYCFISLTKTKCMINPQNEFFYGKKNQAYFIKTIYCINTVATPVYRYLVSDLRIIFVSFVLAETFAKV